MKKGLFLLSALALLLTACNKNLQRPDDLKVNPDPLVVVAGEVNADITGSFPEKTFVKKGVLHVTPVLKFGAEEVVGETVTYVGEKAKENGKTVNYKNGGKYKQHFSCKYAPAMAKSELYLRFSGNVGKKEYNDIPDMKVADGILATAQIAEATDNHAVNTPDKFQRVIQEMQEADIHFLIQQANLRNSETNSEAVQALQQAIIDAVKDDNKAVNSLVISGYASPDGSEKLNDRLASQRQAVTERYLKQVLKKNKVSADVEGTTTAEDWEGFQKLMEESNIQDKGLVLRVLSMYSDPEEREAQIKNLSAVYESIADQILPALRRSRLVLTTDLIGKTDEQILEIAKSDPAQLSVEELLYAASLVEDDNEKAKIYIKTTELYPNDYRAFNNLGMIYFEQGNIAEARRCYQNALNLNSNNPDVNYNAGIAAMADGDTKKANEYLGKAAGTQGNLNAALGTYYTMTGDYKKASASYGNSATNNAAVQQILNEDYAAARQTLANVQNPNATTAYLSAIVGARTNDRDAVYSNLKVAVEKDPSLKQKAQNDIEFARYITDDAFLAIVK